MPAAVVRDPRRYLAVRVTAASARQFSFDASTIAGSGILTVEIYAIRRGRGPWPERARFLIHEEALPDVVDPRSHGRLRRGTFQGTVGLRDDEALVGWRVRWTGDGRSSVTIPAKGWYSPEL